MSHTATNELKTLDIHSLARLLVVSHRTIRRWTQQGILPAPIRVTRSTVRWKYDDIQAWMSARPKGLNP